jgi:hypothetical protein
MQKLRAIGAIEHASLVLIEQVHGARAVMAAAATRDAIGPAWIGETFDGWKGHRQLL